MVVVLIWVVGHYGLAIGFAIFGTIIGIDMGSEEYGLEPTGPSALAFAYFLAALVWGGYFLTSMYLLLGPGPASAEKDHPLVGHFAKWHFECGNCMRIMRVPILVCPHCQKRSPRGITGGHVLGIVLGFCMATLTVHFLVTTYFVGFLCNYSIVCGLVVSVLFLLDVRWYGDAVGEVRRQLTNME